MHLIPKACLILSLASAQLVAGTYSASFADAGGRFGTDAENGVDLMSYELFVTHHSPWSWELENNVRIDLNLETAIGALTGEDETAAYLRMAPILDVSYNEAPVSLILSSGPSLYSEDTFKHHNLGGNFQFTSSIGLNWKTHENWTLGYRYQHTSNANLDTPNPGLEMHTLGLARSF